MGVWLRGARELSVPNWLTSEDWKLFGNENSQSLPPLKLMLHRSSPSSSSTSSVSCTAARTRSARRGCCARARASSNRWYTASSVPGQEGCGSSVALAPIESEDEFEGAGARAEEEWKCEEEEEDMMRSESETTGSAIAAAR